MHPYITSFDINFMPAKKLETHTFMKYVYEGGPYVGDRSVIIRESLGDVPGTD